jgi:hypothetical protein
MQIKTTRNVIYYFSLIVFRVNRKGLSLKWFLDSFFKSFIIELISEIEIILSKDGIIIFKAKILIIPNNFLEVSIFFLHFLFNLFVVSLYIQRKLNLFFNFVFVIV